MKGYWGKCHPHYQKKVLLGTDNGQFEGNGLPSLIISALLIFLSYINIPYVDYVSEKKNVSNAKTSEHNLFWGEGKLRVVSTPIISIGRESIQMLQFSDLKLYGF